MFLLSVVKYISTMKKQPFTSAERKRCSRENIKPSMSAYECKQYAKDIVKSELARQKRKAASMSASERKQYAEDEVKSELARQRRKAASISASERK